MYLYRKKGRAFGGAALEYIIISLFGMAITAAGIGMMSTFYKDKLQSISEKAGLDFSEDSFDFGNIVGE